MYGMIVVYVGYIVLTWLAFVFLVPMIAPICSQCIAPRYFLVPMSVFCLGMSAFFFFFSLPPWPLFLLPVLGWLMVGIVGSVLYAQWRVITVCDHAQHLCLLYVSILPIYTFLLTCTIIGFVGHFIAIYTHIYI